MIWQFPLQFSEIVKPIEWGYGGGMTRTGGNQLKSVVGELPRDDRKVNVEAGVKRAVIVLTRMEIPNVWGYRASQSAKIA